MARKLEVEIVGDASSLHKAFGKASSSSSKFGNALGKTVKAGAVVAGAALGGLAVATKIGVSEFMEAQRVTAQTGAVLKSTGGAAKVTTKQVEDLASSLSKMSGVDDEAIQSGENLLLTFTNIRNEVGKGNDIFNQATKATLDLSVAMGKDMSSSALLVGKALNDPVKGMTALTKAGIQFTDAQKKAIQKLVESGDKMGAQKIILKELEKQFGGSAKAAGDTLGGQINKLRNRFDEFAGGLVKRAIPALTDFFGKLDKAKGFQAKLNVVWTGVQDAAKTLGGKLREAMGKVDWAAVWAGARGIGAGLEARFKAIDWKPVGAAIGAGISAGVTFTAEAVQRLSEAFNRMAREIDWVAVGRAMGPGLAAAVATAFVTIMDPSFWAKNWDLALSVLLSVFRVKIFGTAGKLIAAALGPLRNVGSRMVLAVVGAIEAVSPRIAAVFLGAITKLPGLFTSALNPLLGVVRAGFGKLSGLAQFTVRVLGIQAVIGAVSQLVGKVKNWFTDLVGWLRGKTEEFHNAGFAIGAAIIQGAISGVASFAGSLKTAAVNAAKGALQAAKDFIKPGSPSKLFAQEIGKPISEGIAKGITDNGPKVTAALSAVLLTAVRKKNFGNVSSIISQLFGEKQGGQTTKSERIIGTIMLRREKEDLDTAITGAEGSLAASQAALAEAVSKGDPAAIAAAQAVVAADQRAVERAKEDKVLFDLRAKAEKERVALEKAQFVAQLKLTARLDSLQKLFDKNHITVGKLLNAVKGILRSLKIPGFAGGVRNFGGGLAVVGERGPELVNLPGGSSVYPTTAGAGGRIVHEHHYHGPVVQDKQFLDYMKNLAAADSRRNGRPAFG